MTFGWSYWAISIISSLIHYDEKANTDQTPETGIYVVIDQKVQGCDQELQMVIWKRKVCLSKKPFISSKELEYATDIRYNFKTKRNYIDIGISSHAVQALNKMVEILPNAQYAIVVEEHVVCLFEMSMEIDTRYIRIGEDATPKDLYTIRGVLRKIQF